MFNFQYKIKRRFLEFDVTLLRFIILISIYTYVTDVYAVCRKCDFARLDHFHNFQPYWSQWLICWACHTMYRTGHFVFWSHCRNVFRLGWAKSMYIWATWKHRIKWSTILYTSHTDSKVEYTFVCMHTNDFVIQVSSHLHGVFAKGTKSDEWWLHVSNFSL